MTAAPVVLDARTATPHFPGVGRSVIGLTRSMAGVVNRRPLVLLHGPAPDPRLPLDVLPGVPCAASPFALRQQWEVRRRLRQTAASLYHSPYYLMPFAPGVPAVVTCHDLIPLTVPGLFDPGRRLAFRLAHALAFRAASAIIVPSRTTAREVAAHFPGHARKLRVIVEGCEFGGLLADSTPPAGAELAAADALSRPYVLSVGSNKPHKNLRVLVNAWAQVSARRAGKPAVRLVLAGPRDARYGEGGATADGLRRDGRLVSVGEVSDAALAGLYRRALLFVLPSRAEGFGLPALEAMTLGAPVLCSRIGALQELCDDAASFFDPGDAGQLATLLDRLLDAPDERTRLREAGLRRAAAFSWSGAALATLSLYEQVIREGR